MPGFAPEDRLLAHWFQPWNGYGFGFVDDAGSSMDLQLGDVVVDLNFGACNLDLDHPQVPVA